MLNLLADYLGTYEDDLNIDIMDKVYDDDLVIYVADAWESLEVVKQIQFLGYDFNIRESEIDVNKHIFRRMKKLPKKEQYKLKMIDDTRCGLFTAHLRITLDEQDPKTGEIIRREKIINKDMLIPLADEEGRFFINGKNYYIIYQLTEKSTYNTRDSNILKSLMPMVVKREAMLVMDTKKNSYTLPVYHTFVYRRQNPIMLFIFANVGIEVGLMELRVHEILKLLPDERDEPDCLYFRISKNCVVEVNKEIFLKYSYVKSVVGGLIAVLGDHFDIENIKDQEEFIKRLTPSGTLDKGLGNLTSFNRMMDKTTRKILQTDDFHKDDVYAVLRWIMIEFENLRMKDNMDLSNKRLRCMEYVASLLTQEFSYKLNGIINLGQNVTLEKICDCFKFPGDQLCRQKVA